MKASEPDRSISLSGTADKPMRDRCLSTAGKPLFRRLWATPRHSQFERPGSCYFPSSSPKTLESSRHALAHGLKPGRFDQILLKGSCPTLPIELISPAA